MENLTLWINNLNPATFILIMWLCIVIGFFLGFVLLALVRNTTDETNRQITRFHDLTDNKYKSQL